MSETHTDARHEFITDGPTWLRKGRVPCLDGLRGIDISLVLMNHASHSAGFVAPFFIPILVRMRLGIDNFLITSGFLITLLLVREYNKTQTISVKDFYFRRALRLFPGYAAFLLVMFLLTRWDQVHLSASDWRGLITHTVNFLPKPSPDVGHIWSLSTQEQFYLLYPLLIFALGPKRSIPVLVGYLAFAPILRLIIWFGFPQYGEMVSFWSFTRFDTIITGCLLALFAFDPEFRRRTHMSDRKALFVGLGLLFGLFAVSLVCIKSSVFFISVGYFLRNVCIAGIAWLCLNHTEGWVGRALKSRLLSSMGVMCYSIYLWQQFFFSSHHAGLIHRWPWNLIPIAVCAIASYHLIEMPFVRLKERRAFSRQALETARREELRHLNDALGPVHADPHPASPRAPQLAEATE